MLKIIYEKYTGITLNEKSSFSFKIMIFIAVFVITQLWNTADHAVTRDRQAVFETFKNRFGRGRGYFRTA